MRIVRRSIGRAGSSRRHHDAGPAGKLAPGFGGHGGAAFMSKYVDADRRLIERVKQGKIGFAGDAEGAIDAVAHQRGGEYLPPVRASPNPVMMD
jgi:hypothetical protein